MQCAIVVYEKWNKQDLKMLNFDVITLFRFLQLTSYTCEMIKLLIFCLITWPLVKTRFYGNYGTCCWYLVTGFILLLSVVQWFCCTVNGTETIIIQLCGMCFSWKYFWGTPVWTNCCIPVSRSLNKLLLESNTIHYLETFKMLQNHQRLYS